VENRAQPCRTPGAEVVGNRARPWKSAAATNHIRHMNRFSIVELDLADLRKRP
jgi:hypothetical protein